jgi:GNAT superfamily N-acetyltransferase
MELGDVEFGDVEFVEWAEPGDASPVLVSAMTECWIEVTNTGGAVGFPSPPISRDDVEPVMTALVASLEATRVRVIIALIEGELAGWVVVAGNSAPIVAHWATVQRLQTRPRFQGHGVGRALMRRVTVTARDAMGLEQLWLTARGGMGLEDYYRNLGWREVGRHPGGLRLAPGDDRDEIFMILTPL